MNRRLAFIMRRSPRSVPSWRRAAAESVPGPRAGADRDDGAPPARGADADRELARKDPARVRKLVDESCCRISNRLLGAPGARKHWRTARPNSGSASSMRSISRCSGTTARAREFTGIA